MFVVDASVVLAWIFDDEGSAAADAVLTRLGGERAAAPSHFPLEVANALRTAERRGRLDDADVRRLQALISALPVEIVPIELPTALYSVLDLARRHDLTAYDAAYLGLAQFRDVPLATIDARLAAASAEAGIELVIA